jgi:hypothetical protein
LDLSKREENAAYNPNPFSIAKTNAAYRPQAPSTVQPIRPVRSSDDTTTNTGAGGLLVDDLLDLSKREENPAYNPNPFSTAKTNAAHRLQAASTVQPIRPVKSSDDTTTNTGAGGLLIDDLDLSKWEENAAYNPNPYAVYRPQASTVHSVRPSDTTNIGDGGLLIDDLDPSIWEEDAAYNPNSFAVCRPQATTVKPIQPVKPSDTTDAGGLLIEDLDPSIWEENAAYNPNPYAVYRPQANTVNGPIVQATQSVRLANKPTKNQQLTKRSRTNQITIMEGFKTQAMKKPRINAFQPRVPPILPTNPISANSNPAVNQQPAGLSPSPTLISSPSPNPSPIPSPSPKPSNYLAKMRKPVDSSSGFMQVKSYPKRDAYQYSTEDLDEEWTTLPSKKKRKRKPKLLFLLDIFRLVC